MAPIRIQGSPGNMGCAITGAAAFPNRQFAASIPEAIGDSARPFWYGTIKPEWSTDRDGRVVSHGAQPGELDYTATFETTDDAVDIRIRLTNRGQAAWKQTIAFNCFSPIGVHDVRDHECLRHWVGMRGKPVPLRTVPRRFGPRPTIQLYPVEGGPPWREIGFVRNFDSTPDDVHLEPWMAIASPDARLVAVASKPGLFLFQNREYSCIHCGPTFGPLGPGDTGYAFTRIYLARQSVAQWYGRMKREMERIDVRG